ncbi:MAG: UDP-glucose/GDP-mannose dehydrogenase family protein [Candidatus Omnitrophica bacterium]|nr:UDP-glucose/GDP-mannose dehydrogenase family protein [Candidatus Omnitrophota bacterium]
MKISIIGSGYVGLVTGTCFADLGNNVICTDNDPAKIEALKKGKVTMYEPGLEELISRNKKEGRLKFTGNIKEAITKSDIIFICVGTPSRDNGEADLTYIENVARSIAAYLDSYKLIVEKSTVPVETGERIKEVIRSEKGERAKFDVASNPEFLKEGSAIDDFLHPDRVVIGVESDKAKMILIELYKPLNAPLVVTDIKGAEIIKHASNSFLATKISFVNALSAICERVGADVVEVSRGIGMDKRIGMSFLNAGVGYGGSCFPKDIDAFIHICEKLGYDFGLLREVKKINAQQKLTVIKKAEGLLWNLPKKTIGVLGLSFKPNTDDIRQAPSVEIIREFQERGCLVKVYDPKAMPKAREVLSKVTFCKNAYDVARGADCLIVVTEWNEFKELDFVKIKKLLKQPVIIDGRNIYDPRLMQKMGFRYAAVGRNIRKA